MLGTRFLGLFRAKPSIKKYHHTESQIDSKTDFEDLCYRLDELKLSQKNTTFEPQYRTRSSLFY